MDMVREILERAARGSYPAADGRIEVLPAPPGPAMAILGFTAHHVIASAAPEEWVRAELAEGDLSAPLKPRFVSRLAEKLGRHDDSLDLLLVAEGLPGPVTLRETDAESHPRVVRALRHRVDVRAFTDAVEQVVVVLGRGLALRHEVAVEVSDSARSRGLARDALLEARRIVGPSGLLFAQAAPANAASVRCLLAAGFAPIGAEVLFFAQEPL